METKLPPSVSMENYSDTDRLGQLPNLNVIASDLYQFNAIIKKNKTKQFGPKLMPSPDTSNYARTWISP